jgi:hypothetical protein
MNKDGAYKRKAANLKNVKARYELLVNGLACPTKVSQTVARALSGQRAFCALSIANSKIRPIALNTLKTLAKELYAVEAGPDENGFALLDRMRIQLKELLETTPSVRSVEAKNGRASARLQKVEDKLISVEQQSACRSKAYFDLYSKLITFVKKDGLDDATRFTLFKLLEQHSASFSYLFNPGHALERATASLGNEGNKEGVSGVVVSIHQEQHK